MLTASVAHEINNPLGYILGCLVLRSADHALAREAAVAEPLAEIRRNLAAAADGPSGAAIVVAVHLLEGRGQRVVRRRPRARGGAAARLAHQIEPRARLSRRPGPYPGDRQRSAPGAGVPEPVDQRRAAIPETSERRRIVVATRVQNDLVVIKSRTTAWA
jgi:signal transduction histidine kinase